MCGGYEITMIMCEGYEITMILCVENVLLILTNTKFGNGNMFDSLTNTKYLEWKMSYF